MIGIGMAADLVDCAPKQEEVAEPSQPKVWWTSSPI